MYTYVFKSQTNEPVFVISPTFNEMMASIRQEKHFHLDPSYSDLLMGTKKWNVLLTFWTKGGDVEKTQYWGAKFLKKQMKLEPDLNVVMTQEHVDALTIGGTLTHTDSGLALIITLSDTVDELALKLQSQGFMQIPESTEVSITQEPSPTTEQLTPVEGTEKVLN